MSLNPEETSFYEAYRLQQFVHANRQQFAERKSPLYLEFVLANQSGDSYLDRQIVLSERTPEAQPYHILWVLKKPVELNREEPKPFAEYYEFCRKELDRIGHAVENVSDGYTLTIFAERFQDEMHHNGGVTAKLSGARECPYETPGAKDMYFHISWEGGTLVYTMPFTETSLEQDYPDDEAPDPNVWYRYLDSAKRFAIRSPTAVAYYAPPSGWEGVNGRMEV